MPWDVVVVGAGVAGLSAAMQASRLGLSCLVLEKLVPGGGACLAKQVENYPGYESIDGWTLTRKFEAAALEAGAEIREEAEVLRVIHAEGKVSVATGDEELTARAVIIASGTREKPLGVPGERRLKGTGVHYCAPCAGYSYRNKRVAVVGSSLMAVENALFLSEIASEVTLIFEEERLRAERPLLERLAEAQNVALLPNARVIAFSGEERLAGVELSVAGERRTLDVEGAFIYAGRVPNSELVDVEKDEEGYILVDCDMQTSARGIFACGGVVRRNARIASSAGEGTVAALSAAEYLGL
ncbi:MAG: FAD-dependent oxidoreductase [Euryarchaeota archaeon]|nr:FAD-dependent oxidoreductase [Euryarchaeota archaeon]